MANAFDQFDEKGGANVFDQFDEQTAEEPEITAGERGLAAVTGVNTLAPALLGLPMDTYTNAVNLARAAYGTGKHLLTGSLDVPEMLPGQVGGSEWFKRKIAKGMGGDPFTPPRPEDPTQQNIHMGSGIIAAGALAPTQGVKQTLGTMAKMAPSAGGAIAAKELFPDEPLAPLAGMLAVPTAAAGASALKAKVAPKVTASQAFIKAHKLGYKVPPALAKPTKTQQAIEGSAGPVPVKQKASIHNQQVTNRLIKQDLGYPKDVPLSREGLDAVRAEAGKVYEQAKGLGTFKTDKLFRKDLSKIANQNSALAKEFPDMVKADVVKLSKTFNKNQISSEALVDAVKQLRADSSAGFRSSDPGVLALAKANGKMANALEALMERSISQGSAASRIGTINSAELKALPSDLANRVKGVNNDYRLPNLKKAVPESYLPAQVKRGDKMVTIYRAVSSDTKAKTIRPGDWVSLDKEYALKHGLGATGKNKIIKQEVPADSVGWAGTDMNEYFYVPRIVETKQISPSLLPQLKAARQRIAKTYEIEKALKGENVDAVALGRALDKGKPLSGLMRDVAEFGQTFKGAAQVNVPQSTNFRPMDLAAGVGSSIATGQPGWLALMAARPMTRAAILSKPYQALLTKAAPQQMAAIKTLPREAQAAAIISLFEEIQNSGESASK